MANDEGKKEDKFDFTDEGEARYIGLDEARILAIQAANETPGDYGRRFRRVSMAFEPQDEEETDDYDRIVLSVRPQGDFTGAPGREEFYVEKLAQAEGAIAHRQVLAVPMPERKHRTGLIQMNNKPDSTAASSIASIKRTDSLSATTMRW